MARRQLEVSNEVAAELAGSQDQMLRELGDQLGVEIFLRGEKEKGDGGEEEGFRKIGWTFRRIDNLRLWTAALRLRYQIPLSSSPLINKSSSDPPFLLFDAKTVARREEGWDTMLEGVVGRWVEEVVGDKRRGK